jgi:phospholipid/cholesterol/gamma-HCH transport system substrate-binding protein
LVTTALLAGAIWLAASVYNGVPLRAYETYYARVPQIGDLLSHDPVRIAGVRVGQVLNLQTTPAGAARLQLQLNPGTHVPRGTNVAIRANGLLGARYVQLIPGRDQQLLPQRATISAGTDALSYGIPQLLDTFTGRTRQNLGTDINQLGIGTLGQGSGINGAIMHLSPALVPFQEMTKAILAYPGSAQRFFPDLDAGLTPFADNSGALTGLVRSSADVASAATVDGARLKGAISATPGALAATQAAARPATQLLAATDDLAAAANGTLPALDGGLRATRTLLHGAPAPLRSATQLLVVARLGVPSARELLRHAQPVLPRLADAIGSLRPMVDYVAPYGCDIANFGVVFRSVTGFGGVGSGPIGPLGEFRLALISPDAEEALGLPSALRTDAYPPPCQNLGNSYPHSGQ